ncbi:MAG: GerAB/ArcD/ProY family transporter, partial [Methylocystaceae bacterium]
KPEVFSLTGFELLIILVLLSTTIAFLVAPGPTFDRVHTSAWYVPILALIPGLLYTLIYQSLITNSPYPLPLMLEYYWGRIIGWLLSFFYACYFLVWVSLWVRLFLDFQLSVINPMQPISVLLAGILIVAMYGLKRGLTTTIRALEIIFGLVVGLEIFLIIMALLKTDFSNLLPLYHTKPLTLATAVLFFSRFYAVTGITLILGHFLIDKSNPGRTARHALILIAFFLAITFMVTMGVIGNLIANDAYPIFDMVRRLQIGSFVRNLDALFIATWFVGVFFGIFILWFGFIYILQQMFRLSDYRPLAPATVMIVGIMAVGLGSNSVEVKDLQLKVMYPLIMIFMVIIPLLTWVIGLIRGQIKLKTTSAKSSS